MENFHHKTLTYVDTEHMIRITSVLLYVMAYIIVLRFDKQKTSILQTLPNLNIPILKINISIFIYILPHNFLSKDIYVRNIFIKLHTRRE